MITAYTTYASIRTVLGLTSKELSDTQLDDEVIEFAVVGELISVGTSIDEDSDIIGEYEDASSDYPDITTVAGQFCAAFRSFSAAAAATSLLGSLPLLVPTYLSDSKVAIKKDVSLATEAVRNFYTQARRRLVEAFAAYLDVDAPAAATPTLLTISSPDYDPVTDE